MSVVVTGSAGFVGRTLVAELVRRGRTRRRDRPPPGAAGDRAGRSRPAGADRRPAAPRRAGRRRARLRRRGRPPGRLPGRARRRRRRRAPAPPRQRARHRPGAGRRAAPRAGRRRLVVLGLRRQQPAGRAASPTRSLPAAATRAARWPSRTLCARRRRRRRPGHRGPARSPSSARASGPTWPSPAGSTRRCAGRPLRDLRLAGAHPRPHRRPRGRAGARDARRARRRTDRRGQRRDRPPADRSAEVVDAVAAATGTRPVRTRRHPGGRGRAGRHLGRHRVLLLRSVGFVPRDRPARRRAARGGDASVARVSAADLAVSA